MRRVFALGRLLSLALCLLPPRAEAWSLVAHTIQADFNSPLTTAGINTTGADLIVVSVVVDTNGTGSTTANPPSITDSKSNGWTQITAQAAGSGTSATYLFFSHNPMVGSGHTFTATTATVPAGTITVQAWSGSVVGMVTDQNSAANTGGATSLQPGSITPSQNNSLVVASFGGLDMDAGDTQSIDGGFALSDQNTFVGGNHYAGAMAYLVQGSAAAINPTWSWTNTSSAAALITDFVPGGGGPVVVNRRALLGMGQ
jgi:hypothetical protein